MPLPKKNVITVNPINNNTKVTLTMDVILALRRVNLFILCFLAIQIDCMKNRFYGKHKFFLKLICKVTKILVTSIVI